MRLHKLFSVLIALCILTMFAAPAFAVIYVNAAATGANDGTSWANAYTDLQQALNFAWGGEIWVAAGTYKPTTTEDRAISFSMPNGVKIYGGFAGTESARDQRDWTTNTTILSGDIGNSGNADNSYHIITSIGLDNTAVLDGFTIIGGNADGDELPNDSGGGIYNQSGNPTISNCIFSGNSAKLGAGMYNQSSSPTVVNCVFSGNSAGGGGGIFIEWDGNPTITGCTFSGNSAGAGGGIGIGGDSRIKATIADCTFSGNSVTDYGGGIFSYPINTQIILNGCSFIGNSAGLAGGGLFVTYEPLIDNCIFSKNSAQRGGGILASLSSTISDCTFSENSAEAGGAIFNEFGDDGSGEKKSQTITNCIFSGNSTTAPSTHEFDDLYGGGGIYNSANGKSIITGSTFSDNSAKSLLGNGDGNGGGIYSDNSNIDIKGCDFSSNSADYRGGGIYSYQCDLKLTDCNFLNNSSVGGGGIYNDNNSNSEISDCNFSSNSTNGGAGILNNQCPSTVIRCSFKNNSVTIEGGGIANYSCNPTIRDSIFSGNMASDWAEGAGLSNYESSPTIINCVFSGNSAQSGNGGGISNHEKSNPSLINCTFFANSAMNGVGIYNSGSSPIITNCILWDTGWGLSIYDEGDSISTVTYSIIQGGYAGEGNLDIDPLFVLPIDPFSAPVTGGDFHLQDISPAINAGNSAAVPAGIITDLDGNPRVVGTAVDMGAYETSVLSLPVEIGLHQEAADIASGGSYDFGSLEMGGNSGAITFTVENTDTAVLVLTGTPKIALSGTDVADFSVDETSTTASVAGSGNTTFMVTFTPSSAGAKTAVISIANNDSDENPYTVTLNGTGTVTPGYTSTPVSGSTIDVGTVEIGASASASLQINETGTAALNITGCTISGANSADFSVSPSSFSIADGGAAQNITIQCTPSAVGTRTATLTVTHNASGSPATYTLNATGTVTPGYASTPVSYSTINIGTAEIGASTSASLQISETGTAALNITGCTISGTNAADFSVSPSSLTIADGGAAQNITIQCTPSAAGTRTATLTVAHNASGSPATYTLNATGTATPGYASSPVSGSTITLMPTEVGVSTSVILQINETGTAALNITGCTITGTNSADFSVSPYTFSIADGGAAQNITIQCTPSAAGTRTAILTVTHNASGSPATYTLNCTATESTITPAVTTAEVSGITATEAVSGGNVAYPENCTATLLASGLVWNTVTPAYPADAHTSAGTEPGSFTGTLTGLLPQTTYYVRAYVQYKLNGVVQVLYGDTYELTTSALPGDVNGDRVLDLKDAIFALKVVTGTSGNAEINLSADVNGDGKIGVEEAVYVLQNVGTAE